MRRAVLAEIAPLPPPPPRADADLVLFDPDKILDHATYEQSGLPSSGIHHVLVNGVFIVKNGQFLEATHPGQPIRAPLSR